MSNTPTSGRWRMWTAGDYRNQALGSPSYPIQYPFRHQTHWTDGIIADISGYGSGVVDIFGENHKVWVTAKVKAEGGALTIPFTGCRYYLSDSVTMDSTSIQFRNIPLRDEEQHTLHLDGALYPMVSRTSATGSMCR